MNLVSKLRTWLGAPVAPILLLAGLNMADEFDRIAFAALSPEIRDAFELNDTTVLMLGVVPGIAILFGASLIGLLADRYSRILVSIAAAFAWMLASVLTGVVPTLAALVAVRVVSGLGRTANEIVHPSLIADLYPEATHPRAYLIHRLGNPIAQGSGVLAGWIADHYGWKWAFVVLAVPTLFMILGLSRLKDPGRRVSNVEIEKISLLSAVRTLRKIPSVRRLWVAAIMLGAASFGIFNLASLYFEKVFQASATERGFVQFIIGVGWTIGVGAGGTLAQRGATSGNYRRLVLLCAGSFLLIAIGSVLLAASPNMTLSYVLIFIPALGNGVWQAPFFSSVARIAPPRLSGQAFGSTATAYAVGGFLTIIIAIVSDSERAGQRVGFLLVALFGLGAAIAAWTVALTVQADINHNHA